MAVGRRQSSRPLEAPGEAEDEGGGTAVCTPTAVRQISVLRPGRSGETVEGIQGGGVAGRSQLGFLSPKKQPESLPGLLDVQPKAGRGA